MNHQRKEEEEDERKEEEEPNPSKGLYLLKLREKLKEKFRQKLKKESSKTFGLSVNSHDNQRTSTTKDNFGSFFGPSQPAIASRVLDEVKRKAQTLKDMRDYSFLLSDDDADFLNHMDPQPASCHADARSTQVQLKNKMPIKRPLKSASNGHELKNVVSLEPRKVSGVGGGGNGHSRPVGSKVPAQSRVLVPILSTSKLNSMAMNSSSLQKNNLTAKPPSSTQNHFQKSQLPKPNPARNTRDGPPPPRKKLVRKRPEEDESVGVSQMIRNMFGYDPSKYDGMDDDDSDMEVGFNQILMEERRSAKIAKEEDDEQLRLIEEEERQGRMRKRHKPNKS